MSLKSKRKEPLQFDIEDLIYDQNNTLKSSRIIPSATSEIINYIPKIKGYSRKLRKLWV